MGSIGSLLANKGSKTCSKQNERRTMLRIRETDDNQQNFINMDIQEFRKLDKPKASIAYSQLLKSIKAIYSGSVNPMVNMLDYKKIKQRLSNNLKKDLITQTEMNLIEEYIKIRRDNE